MFLIPASSLQLIWTPTTQLGVLSAPSAWCWFSLPHLISNWLNFLCTELYNILTRTLLPVSVTISHSIQPVHGQGYILIFLDRMHLLFTQVYFLFWQLGRGQYVTIGRIKTFQTTTVFRLDRILFVILLVYVLWLINLCRLFNVNPFLYKNSSISKNSA